MLCTKWNLSFIRRHRVFLFNERGRCAISTGNNEAESLPKSLVMCHASYSTRRRHNCCQTCGQHPFFCDFSFVVGHFSIFIVVHLGPQVLVWLVIFQVFYVRFEEKLYFFWINLWEDKSAGGRPSQLCEFSPLLSLPAVFTGTFQSTQIGGEIGAAFSLRKNGSVFACEYQILVQQQA